MKDKLSTLIGKMRYGDRIRPVRDWFVLLSVAGVLILVSIVWNAWLFSQLEQGKSFGAATMPVRKVQTNSIGTVQNVFQKRAAEQTRYQDAYQFVDPSH